MKIEEVRPSFSVYLVSSQLAQWDGIDESLKLAGYNSVGFEDLKSALASVPSNPPHFLLFDLEEKAFNLKKAIKDISFQLPESHIFLLASEKSRPQAAKFLDYGVYDIIYLPLVSPAELLRPLDRAAERDFLWYANERLAQVPEPIESAENEQLEGPTPSASDEAMLPPPIPMVVAAPQPAQTHDREYVRQLFEQKTADDCVATFMSFASSHLGSCGVVYFKYFPNRRVLMAAQAHGVSGEIGGIGLNFNEKGSKFRTAQLREPQEISELSELIQEVFSVSHFVAVPLNVLSEVQGVITFLRPHPEPSVMGIVNEWLMLLSKALDLIETEKRLHVVSIKDPYTDLLNRHNFILKAQQEVSRARRTSLPVSMLLICVDQYGKILATVGQEEAQAVMRTTAKIFEKHSRVNDIVGRTSGDEFGLILPHTGRQGAMIKAERLRRMIQSADYSKVIKEFPRITISIGISEYPGFVRDADELVQSADEALLQVRQEGNKSCLAQIPEGFKPDFHVLQKG